MTSPIPFAEPTADCGCTLPTPTPVLLHRELVPGTDQRTVSVFGDDIWDLTPGVFEAHASAISLNFAIRPAALRQATKHYFWQLINHRSPARLRWANTARLSLLSVTNALHHFAAFLTWLDAHQLSDEVGGRTGWRSNHGNQGHVASGSSVYQCFDVVTTFTKM
jgi:hypothetical protein